MNEVITHTRATEMAATYNENIPKIRQKLIEIRSLVEDMRTKFRGNNDFEQNEHRTSMPFEFTISSSAGEKAIAEIIRCFKQEAWGELISKLGIAKFMSTRRREQLRNLLQPGYKKNPRIEDDTDIDDFPEITEEEILSTMQAYAIGAGEYFDESVHECWQYWRPQNCRYVTNQEQWRVSEKVIQTWIVDGFYTNKNGRPSCHIKYEARSRLTLLDNVMHLLDGKGFVKGHKGPLVSAIEDSGRGVTGETDYFKFRVYKNGNIHLFFLNQKLLDRFNEVGCGGDTGLPNPTGTVIIKSELEGQPPNNSKSKGLDFYATSERVVDRIYSLLEIPTRMGKHHGEYEIEQEILEPSAGDGAIVRRLQKSQRHSITAIEIDPGRCKKIGSPDYRMAVIQKDFLKVKPFAKFDRVAMNPPFSGQRALFHVYHAYKFLKLGGQLVAVMTPSWQTNDDKYAAAFRDFVNKVGYEWHGLPDGSFKHAGTYVKTGVIVLRRPKPITQGDVFLANVRKQTQLKIEGAA